MLSPRLPPILKDILNFTSAVTFSRKSSFVLLLYLIPSPVRRPSVCPPRQPRMGLNLGSATSRGTEATSVEGLTALLALAGRPAQPHYVINPILPVKKWNLEIVKELTGVTQLLGGGTGAEAWRSHVRASAVLEGPSVERREAGAL